MVIVKRFEFSYAHILPLHEGKCKRLHGHNAILEVEVSNGIDPGAAAGLPGTSSDGMVVDFGDLKDIVKRAVLDVWDHRFLAAGDEWVCDPAQQLGRNEDIVLIGVRTTAENLSKLAFELITNALVDESHVKLTGVRFYETPDSYAEYADIDYDYDGAGVSYEEVGTDSGHH